ncbi:MAG: lipopolysaccharide transport periplasmic protein LptA [Vogesella sp.]|uniref:lipopolysaccharide transport periplasmic protein LptA n=1 Tax=Vogesella sp. TaxID=1904252 RepID=UPI00391C4DEB
MHHRLLLALLLSATAPAALAEKADSSKPIEVNADSAALDQKQGVNVFEGNVVITQGTLSLRADKTVTTRDASGRQKLVATGNPVHFRQKLDGQTEYVDGRAARVDYDSASNTVILTGKAVVTRGKDMVAGELISYNTVTEVYQVKGQGATSTAPKGRVTIILQPQEKP